MVLTLSIDCTIYSKLWPPNLPHSHMMKIWQLDSLLALTTVPTSYLSPHSLLLGALGLLPTQLSPHRLWAYFLHHWVSPPRSFSLPCHVLLHLPLPMIAFPKDSPTNGFQGPCVNWGSAAILEVGAICGISQKDAIFHIGTHFQNDSKKAA